MLDNQSKRFPLRDLTVIAPCFNEADNITELVRRTLVTFDRHQISGEIVLIDDASTDQTFAKIEEACAADTRVVGVKHEKNRGLFEGWRSGIQNAQGRFVCLIDADLQNPPEEIARLYRVIRNDAVDVVQAVRSSIGRLREGRYVLSRGLNVILNTVFGLRAADNKSGFLLAHRDVLADILEFRLAYRYPHTFVRVAAERKGYSVEEVETLFAERRAGSSFLGNRFPIKTITVALGDIVKALFEFRMTARDNDLDRFLRAHAPLREPEPYTGWRRIALELYFLTMPLHKWMIRRPARNLFFALRRSQYLSRTDLEKYRLLKLRRLLRHAYNHVAYYQAQFDKIGVMPEDIHDLDDLAKFPMLTKKDVRENLYFDLFADNHKKKEMLKITTSGSTGEPFVIYGDKHQLELRMATTMRAAEWTGWRFGDRQARLWHQTIGMTWSQVIREKIDAWFMRRVFVPAYELRDDNIQKFVHRIRRHNPVLVDGYAESFNFLAHYARDHKLQGFRPKAIMTSAQIMPAKVRRIIENVFGAPVFDKYGAREFSGIAYEDDGHDGHLVMAESYIVEIIKDGRPAKPGEIGEVVITDLNNYHLPIIRYRIGDLAQAMDDNLPSRSGRQFPRIGPIEGRAQAVVVCSNGAWLPSAFFLHYLKDYDHIIRQFQIVQSVPDAIIIRVVPGPLYAEPGIEQIVTGLRPYIGETMGVSIELVDQIPMVRTGKRTSVVSHLDLDFQKLADEPRTAEGLGGAKTVGIAPEPSIQKF